MNGEATVEALRWRFGDPVEELIALRARGGVIAFPTESSYGLGVDPNNATAVAEVERIKRRSPTRNGADAEPADKSMPVVFADLSQLASLGIDRDLPAVRRFAAFWPAPLTAVLPLDEGIDLAAARGRRTLAVRIPDHPELRALLAAIGPLTATSANRTGEPPLLSASAVLALLEEAEIADAAVVAGEAPGGPPSTLVGCDGDEFRILRQGPFPAERLLGTGESSPSSRGDS